MSLQSEIKTALAGNPSLAAAFTGGIITVDDMPGLNALTQRVSAFDANEELKPIIIIRERVRLFTNAVTDEGAQRRSFVQSVEIHMLASRATTMEALLGHMDTVYTVLHDKRINGYMLQIREQEIQSNLSDLGYARHVRAVYDAYGVA